LFEHVKSGKKYLKRNLTTVHMENWKRPSCKSPVEVPFGG